MSPVARLRGLLFVISCLHGLWSSSGAKILMVNNFYSGSPLLSLLSISETLVERGHQVDIIKWKDQHDYPIKKHNNITLIALTMDNSKGDWTLLTKGEHAAFRYPHEILTISQGMSRLPNLNGFSLMWEFFHYYNYHCDTLFRNKKLFHRLQEEKYDIAIVDILGNDCGLALTHQLNIPIIGYWGTIFSSAHPDFTTASLPASHIPATLTQFGHEMNFFERTLNLLSKMGVRVMISLYFYVANYSIQKYYPGTPYPSDLLKNVNGMLILSDPAIEYPRLLPPTFINVAGFQIRPLKPLSKGIEDWVESSGNHGVVLVAMGVTHDLNLVNKKVVGYFMEAFRRFPQKFIVKFEGSIENVPSNVKVLKWIPQHDILGHNKTKAFITHCGVNGVFEAAYYGVPMICMPLAVDHGDMFTRVQEKGMAIGLDKYTVTTNDIYRQLKEILYNSKYKSNAMRVSGIMRDVKETPRERTVEFIEYMIRQKGAKHLMLSSRHLNWFQYHSLDSLAFLLLISLLLIYILNKSVKLASRILCYYQDKERLEKKLA